MTRARAWLWAALSSRRATFLVVGAGLLLTSSSLGSGLMGDDHFQRAMAGGYAFIQRAPYDMFRFVSDEPAEHRAALDHGALPWFTSEHARLAFFRPLSSLSTWADYALLPWLPWLFHLESLALYGVLIALVLALYRAILPSAPLAALAGLLYAIDEAHGMPVGWLANRNALFAASFGVGAVLLHHHGRTRNPWAGWVLGPLCLALGLLSGEVALSGFGYLVAYALAFDPSPLRRRLLSLVPSAAVVAAWAIVVRAIGFGVRGSAFYVDPVESPLRFLTALPGRALTLAMAQLALPTAELWTFWASRPWPLQLALALFAALVLGLIGWVIAPVLRSDRGARFFVLGMSCSLFLATAVLPADRSLLFSGVGAFGLVALVIGNLASPDPERGPGLRRLRAAFLGIHLVLAPLVLPLTAASPGLAHHLLSNSVQGLVGDPVLAKQTLVIVNLPNLLIPAFYLATPPERGALIPGRLRVLPATGGPVEITREDERTLVIALDPADVVDPSEGLVRASSQQFRPGEQVAIAGLTFTVMRVDDAGRLVAVRCQFDVPLEDPSLRWIAWSSLSYAEFRPPPVGATVRVAP